MPVDPSAISPNILNDLGERGHDEAAIRAMTPSELFAEYCEWNGLIGYGPMLEQALDNLRAASRHPDDA